ncbi:hypothetical protein NP83_00315 [Neobacillus niacini]|nr:hypothetical protein NP83_00315 [Neobacillus niacini]
MYFNDYEKRQLMKLRQKEVEKKAANAWQMFDLQKESFFQRIISRFKTRRDTTIVKNNCECVCC